MITQMKQCTVCKAHDGFHHRRAKDNHRVCLPSHKGEPASIHFDAAALISVDDRGLCQFHATLRDGVGGSPNG